MRLEIHATEEDGQFITSCPMLPGCTGRGTTLREAVEKHAEAIWGYLASATNFVPGQLVLEVDSPSRQTFWLHHQTHQPV